MIAVILAGGSGTRLWPLSRTAFPKQFLALDGVFEHFYDDSVFGEQMTTHYVVNAFDMVLPDNSAQLPVLQHSAYRWLSESELLDDVQVHFHSKWYFDSENGYRT